jgi:hypothetical protein
MKVYAVMATSEFSDGAIKIVEPKYFPTRERAEAHAEHLAGAPEVDGVFSGNWVHNSYSTFFEDAPKQVRITARIVETTSDDLAAAIDDLAN